MIKDYDALFCPLCEKMLFPNNQDEYYYTFHNSGNGSCTLYNFLYSTDSKWKIQTYDAYYNRLKYFISNPNEYRPVAKNQIIKEL